MSRPIKFRKWDKDLKRMHVCGEDMRDSIIFDDNNEAYYYNEAWYYNLDKDKAYELMQYTGLKDKNGKGIYEGDILRDDRGIGEVEWVQEHCAYMIFTKDPSFYYHMESDGVLKNTEIIGNIYETPLEDTP